MGEAKGLLWPIHTYNFEAGGSLLVLGDTPHSLIVRNAQLWSTGRGKILSLTQLAGLGGHQSLLEPSSSYTDSALDIQRPSVQEAIVNGCRTGPEKRLKCKSQGGYSWGWNRAAFPYHARRSVLIQACSQESTQDVVVCALDRWMQKLGNEQVALVRHFEECTDQPDVEPKLQSYPYWL